MSIIDTSPEAVAAASRELISTFERAAARGAELQRSLEAAQAAAEHHAKQQIKDAFAAGVEAGMRIARSQA
jgi:hypothetical protein